MSHHRAALRLLLPCAVACVAAISAALFLSGLVDQAPAYGLSQSGGIAVRVVVAARLTVCVSVRTSANCASLAKEAGSTESITDVRVREEDSYATAVPTVEAVAISNDGAHLSLSLLGGSSTDPTSAVYIALMNF